MSGVTGAGAGAAKLDVVRKLLTKAERAATPAEAEAYTAKAVQLSARHGIDTALLAADDPARDGIGGTRVPVPARYSAGHARLLGWIADALGCHAVLHGLSGGRVAAVTVFGHASDRERVAVLHASLVLQATAQIDRLRPPDPRESVAAYRRSWLLGFAAEVHRRLTAAERAAAHDATAGTSTGGPEGNGGPGAAVAAVLADRRARVEAAYAAAYPALGAARRTALRGTGFAAGSAAGARADLGGGGLGRSGLGGGGLGGPARAIGT